MKAYRIVKEASIAELESEVEKLMTQGWLPQGGIAVTRDDLGCPLLYYQAMVAE